MIVNKEGKIIANLAQPTVIFDTKAEYDDWEKTLPELEEGTEEEKKAFKEKMLSRFVIIKKYETVECEGTVIFCATEDDMKGTDKATEEHEKIDGAVYVVKANNKLYRYSKVEGADTWTIVGGAGGIKYVTALPAIADAEEDILYIVSSTLSKYVLKVNTTTDPVTKEFVNVGNEVAIIDNFVVAAHQDKDMASNTTTADREKGSVVIDTVNGKSLVSLGVVNDATKDAWFVFASSNSSAEFAATRTQFPNTSEALFPALSSLPTGYKKEDRFFIARDDMSMYVIEEKTVASVTTYYYSQVSQILDNIEVHDYKDSSTAPSSYTGSDFFPAKKDAKKTKIYVAKLEGMIYTYDEVKGYIAVGGDNEVQVFDKKASFPTEGTGGKLFVALDEAQCYVWDTTQTPATYVLVSDRTTVIYASKADATDPKDNFPEVGREGLIYIAKDTGKMYYYNQDSTATDKYILLGDCQDVVIRTYDELQTITWQEDVLYIASDTKQMFFAEPASNRDMAPGNLKASPNAAIPMQLVPVGGGEIKSMTQDAWNKLAEADRPNMAYITDSVFDAKGFKD